MKRKFTNLCMMAFTMLACVSFCACGGGSDGEDPVLGDIDKSRDSNTENNQGSTNKPGDNSGSNNTQDKYPAAGEAVDLGLSVKWASCNVGASTPEDYGEYFAWGETKGSKRNKKSFDWSTYKWCSNSSSTMLTKYNFDSAYGNVDNKYTLDSSDDAATANWGSKWRTPTREEFEELASNCRWISTSINGVEGHKIVSNNGNSIFLPNGGRIDANGLYFNGSHGMYWCNTLPEYRSWENMDPCFAHVFSIFDYGEIGDGIRTTGCSVRAVCE